MSLKRINFFVPVKIVKSGEGELPSMELEGIASTTDEDSDKETLNPKGYNLKPFLNYGFVNWNHKSKEDPLAIIGEPIEAYITNDNKLYVKVRLYPDSAKAKKVWELAETLEKASSTRRLGFSIEGFPKQLDPINTKKVLTADITGLAITTTPKNKNTFASIVKGEYEEPFLEDDEKQDEEIEKMMTTSVISPTTPESLEGSPIRGQDITKSQVYSLIGESLSTDSPEILKSVYNFLEKNNMEKNKGSIEKALTELQDKLNLEKSEETTLENTQGEASTASQETAEVKPEEKTAEDLEKSDTSVLEKSDDGDEDDSIEKAAKDCYEDGMSSDSLTEKLIRKGFSLPESMTASKSVVSEMNEKKQGGDIQKMPEASSQISKSEEDLFSKFSKELSGKIGLVVDAFKTVALKQEEAITGLTEKVELMKSENEKISELLEAAPKGRKSVTSSFKERFEESKIEKSEDPLEGFNLQTKAGREALCDSLLEKAKDSSLSKEDSETLYKAVPSIELSGSIQPQYLKKIKSLLSDL